MSSNLLVNDLSSIGLTLQNINWDFYPKPLSSTKHPRLINCRKYHWYPATFIPEIPYTLIEILTKPGAKIFDPFVGIGTTYFQALLLNRIPFGADICSFSVTFTNLLLDLFKPGINLSCIYDDIVENISKFDKKTNYFKSLEGQKKTSHLKLMRKWYTKTNFNALCFLMLLESTLEDCFAKAALKLSISSILYTASNQDRGWGCVADNVLPKAHQIKSIDVIQIFKRALNNLTTDIDDLKYRIDYETVYNEATKSRSIFHSSITDFDQINDNSIDLVLTSPPYPNMVDYTTSQRLSYYYLGFDMDKDKKREIGARHMRKRKSSLEDYLKGMSQANKIISKTIKKGGLFCYIMPSFNTNNQNNLMRKSIVQKVISNLEDFGLMKQFELKRSIPSIKRSHNTKWATLDSELIHIFVKL